MDIATDCMAFRKISVGIKGGMNFGVIEQLVHLFHFMRILLF